MSTRKTPLQVVSELQEVWGDRWDYSQVVYRNNRTSITLVCKEHGEFQQNPYKALQGQVGCSHCNGTLVTTETVVSKSLEVWGDRWDYSQTVYLNRKTPLTIRCREHGEFNQDIYSHLAGNVGCRHCSGKYLTSEEYISKAREVWVDRWDYSSTEYLGAVNEITVVCPQHGPFTQLAHIHLKGHVGCRPCLGIVYDLGSYLDKVKTVWDNRWDYSETEYVSSTGSISVICKEHGKFQQGADVHSWGHVGCKECVGVGTSTAEKELLEFLDSTGLEVERNKRGILPNKAWEFDAYIPALKIGIEFNGVYWHSERFKDRTYHYDKWKMSQEQGVHLLQVWEDDWRDKKEIIKRHLLRTLHRSVEEKVNARSLHIQPISYTEAASFLLENHIQGPTSASVYLGGFYQGRLVAVSLFLQRKQGREYELVRYATSCLVRGGHSKLVSWFERNYSYHKLITFADLTFGSGDLYKKTGWLEDSILPPDYMYLRASSRHHKFGYRVGRFRKDPTLKFEEGLTERQLAQLNNLHRVYDAGKIRFIKPHPSLLPY